MFEPKLPKALPSGRVLFSFFESRATAELSGLPQYSPVGDITVRAADIIETAVYQDFPDRVGVYRGGGRRNIMMVYGTHEQVISAITEALRG